MASHKKPTATHLCSSTCDADKRISGSVSSIPEMTLCTEGKEHHIRDQEHYIT